MTNKLLILICLGLLSCDGGKSNDPEPKEAVFGWRSAGLVLPDAMDRGGLHQVVQVGEHLFAMDAYTLPSTWGDSANMRYYQWRIYKGRLGSLAWDTLRMPEGRVPQTMLSKNNRLYVGMKYHGEVWFYDPSILQWSQLRMPPLPSIPSPTGFQTVATLAEYEGELVIGMTTTGSPDHYTWLGGIQDTVGVFMPGIGPVGTFPVGNVQEFGDYLYGIDFQTGVYRWKRGMTAWEKLPSPRGRPESIARDLCVTLSQAAGYTGALSCPDTIANPQEEWVSAIGVHEGKLFIGYQNFQSGLYRLEDNGNWTRMTPNGSTEDLNEAPRDLFTIFSYQGRFFIAGVHYSNPRMWVPYNREVPAFGDWRILPDGWCNYDEYGCGTQTRSMIGIGDTIYATAWSALLKCPISDLDSMTQMLYFKDVYPSHLDTARGAWENGVGREE